MNNMIPQVLPSGIIFIMLTLSSELFKEKLSGTTYYSLYKLSIFIYIIHFSILVNTFVHPSRNIQIAPVSSGTLESVVAPLNKGTDVYIQTSENIMDMIAIIWICGIFVLSLKKAYDFIRFQKLLKAKKIVCDKQVVLCTNRTKTSLGIKKSVIIQHSTLFRVPVTTSILLRPIILLPHNFVLNEWELNVILKHELVHIKRKDLYLKYIIEILKIMYWYNPFIYLLQNKINLYSEISCDENVVETTAEDKKFYIETMLRFVTCRDFTKKTTTKFCEKNINEKNRVDYEEK